MSLLLTAPYDPWKQTDWVSHIIGLASQMQQQREKDAITRQQHEDQMRQQGLSDQRRAFEFDRRLEFDRARTAADDNRADRTLSLAESENAPFVVPGAGGPPSSSVPALPTNDGTSSGGTPSGGTPDSLAPLPSLDAPTGDGGSGDSTDTPEDAKARQEAWDDLLPHKAGDPDNVRRSKSTGQQVTLLPGEVSPNEAPPAKPAPAPSAPVPILPTATPSVIPGLDDAAPAPSTAGVIPGVGDVNSIPGMPGVPSIPMPSADPAPPSATVPRLPVAAPEVPVAPPGSALMPQEVPTNPKKPALTPAEQIAEITRSLSGSGLSKKQAQGVIAHVAGTVLSKSPTVTGAADTASKPIVRNFADGSTQQWDADNKTWVKLAEKKSAESETMADAVGDATYNKDHGTYQRPDGSEFFLNKGANGKFTQRAFRPDQKPAKILWGSDGEIYPHDSHGQPLKPVPDGVVLRDHATMQTAKTPGGGVMIVDPDGSLKPLIPEGIKMDAKSQDKYVDAAKTLRQAQVELDTQTKLLHDNPGTTGWFGGGTKEAVAAAQKKFDDAKGEVEGLRKTFPELNPGAMAGQAGQAPGQAPTKYPIGATAVKDGKTYVRTATGWIPQ